MRAKVFKFCIHLESGQVYCGKESQDAEINFCFLFPFLLFSISHSNVIHREIFVKDFSGTAAPRIFEIWYKFWVWLVALCKRESAPWCLPFSLFVHFSFESNFLLQISRLLWEPESSNFLYTWEWPNILWDRKPRCWDLFLPSFSIFSISHSNVIHRESCVKDFSGTTAPRIFKFGTNVGYDCCIV